MTAPHDGARIRAATKKGEATPPASLIAPYRPRGPMGIADRLVALAFLFIAALPWALVVWWFS